MRTQRLEDDEPECEGVGERRDDAHHALWRHVDKRARRVLGEGACHQRAAAASGRHRQRGRDAKVAQTCAELPVEEDVCWLDIPMEHHRFVLSSRVKVNEGPCGVAGRGEGEGAGRIRGERVWR